MTPPALFPDPAALFVVLISAGLFFLALFLLQTLLNATRRDWGLPPEAHPPAGPWATAALFCAVAAILALVWGGAHGPR